MSQERDDGLDGIGDGLRGALESWVVPAAAEGFRAGLRESFLSTTHAAAGVGTDGDSQERLEAGLEEWEVPGARVEFRERLRREFLAAGAREDSIRPPGRGRWLSLPRLVTTLAAAALVFFLATVMRPTPAAWQVVEFAQHASFQLNGERFAGSATERVSQAVMDDGCALATGEDNLTLLHLGEGLLLEIPPGTELQVRPRVGEDTPFEIDVTRGGLRVATSETFTGSVLVHTPDATIALAGRSIGIDVVPEGTCLCVLAGAADLRGRPGAKLEPFTVGSSSTAFVGRDGVVSRRAQGDVMHRAELEEFSELGEKYLF